MSFTSGELREQETSPVADQALPQTLSSTLSIEVSTNVGCKVMCNYCPQKVFIKEFKSQSRLRFMSLETFQKCLENVPRGTRIYFSGFSEPWLNPECTDMVLYAAEHGYDPYVYSTGVGMTLEDVERLSVLDLNGKFMVHVPEDGDCMRIKVTPEYVELIHAIHRTWPGAQGICQIVDPGAKIHPALADLYESPDGPRLILDDASSRAGNLDDPRMPTPERLRGKLGICANLDGGILLPDGSVTLCSADWGMKHVIGSLLDTPLLELKKSEEMQRVLRGLTDESMDILCRNCERAVPARKSHEHLHILQWIYKGNAPLQRLLKGMSTVTFSRRVLSRVKRWVPGAAGLRKMGKSS